MKFYGLHQISYHKNKPHFPLAHNHKTTPPIYWKEPFTSRKKGRANGERGTQKNKKYEGKKAWKENPNELDTMASCGNFCPKSIWDKFQFQVQVSRKSEKIKAPRRLIRMSTMKPKLFWIQIWWYQTFLII